MNNKYVIVMLKQIYEQLKFNIWWYLFASHIEKVSYSLGLIGECWRTSKGEVVNPYKIYKSKIKNWFIGV